MPVAGSRTAFGIAFGVGAAATALPIFAVDLLPLVDLPQHEALVSILQRWNDPSCGFPELYEIDPFEPYWLGYLLAWALSIPFGVALAFKILIAAVLIAIPLVSLRLVTIFGGEPWWVVPLFPFGFGLATSWGFFSFLVAVPWMLLLLAVGFRFARAPTLGRGAVLSFALLLLFAAHLLAFGIGFLILAAILAMSEPSAGTRLQRLWPLAIPAAVAVAWVADSPRAKSAGARSFRFGWSVDRFSELPVQLTGIPDDLWAALAVAAALVAIALCGARWSRDRARWIPLAATLGVLLFAPARIFGTSYFPARFAILLLPALLCALDRREIGGRRRLVSRVAIGLVSFVLLATAGRRLDALDREGAGLAEVLAAAPDGQRLLYLPYDRGSFRSPDPVFAYSGSRYAVGRCGVAEKSFARYDQLPIRFRAGVAVPLPDFIEFAPHRFRWSEHGGETFDLVLVRSRVEPSPERITRGEGRLELLEHRARWWLYRTVR